MDFVIFDTQSQLIYKREKRNHIILHPDDPAKTKASHTSGYEFSKRCDVPWSTV